MAALSLVELRERIAALTARLDDPAPLAADEAAEAIRLWNTAAHYGVAEDYVERLRRDFSARIAPALDLEVTRGFALRSPSHDLTFGGTLPEGSRYRVEELES